MVCSVAENTYIQKGTIADYRKLESFHYRSGSLGPFTAIYKLKYKKTLAGVIIYRPATMGLELRNTALNNLFKGFDNKTRLALINKNIECIARVIIEPRFRGLSLAQKLIKQTMPQRNRPVIESVAVMGKVNPFFQKAGMTAYHAPVSERCSRMQEALKIIGIKETDHIDPESVHEKFTRLSKRDKDFLETEIRHFLKSYGKSGLLEPGLKRTTFILSRISERPTYFIWLNPKLNLIN